MQVDAQLEVELMLGQWQRDGLRRTLERMAAQQLGEAFRDLDLPCTVQPDAPKVAA